MSQKKVLVIVPAYNEAENIQNTLRSLLMLKDQAKEKVTIDICVINDGSSDETSSLAKAFPIIVVDLPFNLGIGGAVQTGYKYAHENNYDIAVQFDGDGQHNIEDFEKIIAPILSNEADLTIGSRYIEKTSYKGTILRRIGIYYFYCLLKLLTGKSFTDPTSGYRAKNKKVIEIFAHNYPKDYPEPEVLVILTRKNFKLQEVSVNMKQRSGGISSITPIRSLYYMIKVSISILMQRVVRG